MNNDKRIVFKKGGYIMEKVNECCCGGTSGLECKLVIKCYT